MGLSGTARHTVRPGASEVHDVGLDAEQAELEGLKQAADPPR